MSGHSKGKLYVLPADFGENTHSTPLLPVAFLPVVTKLRHFIVEEVRTARRFLRRAGYEPPFEETEFRILNEHTDPSGFPELMQSLLNGHDTGLLSEAGMPCIADPGYQAVRLAHQNGIPVEVIPGPNSIIMTLAGSGLNGQNFCFHGYLPVDRRERMKRLKEIEKEAKTSCHLFIEAPYRNNALLEDITESLAPSTLLCIGKEAGIPGGWIKTKSVEQWKKQKPDLHKKPCVFGLQQSW